MDETRAEIVFPSQDEIDQDMQIRHDHNLWYLPEMRYEFVTSVAVDDKKANGHHLFREKYFPSIRLVSDDFKRMIEESKLVGPGFISTQ